MNASSNQKRTGVAYLLMASIMWGFMPLYWKLLDSVPTYELIAHRVVWAVVFIGLFLYFKKDLGKVKTIVKNRKSMLFLIYCAVATCINWSILLWCIFSGHLLDASMGCYVSPLVIVLLGILVAEGEIEPLE